MTLVVTETEKITHHQTCIRYPLLPLSGTGQYTKLRRWPPPDDAAAVQTHIAAAAACDTGESSCCAADDASLGLAVEILVPAGARGQCGGIVSAKGGTSSGICHKSGSDGKMQHTMAIQHLGRYSRQAGCSDSQCVDLLLVLLLQLRSLELHRRSHDVILHLNNHATHHWPCESRQSCACPSQMKVQHDNA